MHICMNKEIHIHVCIYIQIYVYTQVEVHRRQAGALLAFVGRQVGSPVDIREAKAMIWSGLRGRTPDGLRGLYSGCLEVYMDDTYIHTYPFIHIYICIQTWMDFRTYITTGGYVENVAEERGRERDRETEIEPCSSRRDRTSEATEQCDDGKNDGEKSADSLRADHLRAKEGNESHDAFGLAQPFC